MNYEEDGHLYSLELVIVELFRIGTTDQSTSSPTLFSNSLRSLFNLPSSALPPFPKDLICASDDLALVLDHFRSFSIRMRWVILAIDFLSTSLLLNRV